MNSNTCSRKGFAWLEVILVIAIGSFFLQVFPSLWKAIDFRSWSRMTALVVNLFALLLLVAIKTSPNVIAELRERRQSAKAKSLEDKKSQLRSEQIAVLERMRESRRRRKF